MSVEAPVSAGVIDPMINEGPVGPDFRLEDNMILVQSKPLHIRQAEEIVDNTWNNSLETNEELKTGEIKKAVTTVIEHPINKAKAIWGQLREQPSLTQEMLSGALLAVDVVSRTKAAPQKQSSAEQRIKKEEVITQDEQVLSFGNKIDRSPYVILEERADIKKKRFVLDENALAQRTTEVRQATRKAKHWAFWAGIRITGALVARFLPGQHPNNESEVVKKDRRPDGSILETIEAIRNIGEFEDEAQAEKLSVEVVDEKPPIKLRHEGEGQPVQEEDVYRVFRDYEIKPTLIEESRIEDYPDLAEVFK